MWTTFQVEGTGSARVCSLGDGRGWAKGSPRGRCGLQAMGVQRPGWLP